MTPQFKHDCSSCFFLGRYKEGAISVDLYVCPNDNESLIYRTGNDGANYASIPRAVYEQFPGRPIYKEIYARMQRLEMV